MTRRSLAKLIIAICLLLDGCLLGLGFFWTGDLVKGVQLFLYFGGPITVLGGWRAYVMLRD